MKYDIVVIGSGLGGLICGSVLAQAGYKVCILEKSSQPGGCMQSYRRGNFHFDTGFHYVGGLENGQSLYNAFDFLGLMELPWLRMDEHFDHVIIGNHEYLLSQGYENFVATLTDDFPHLHEQISSYADRLRNITYGDMDVNAWQYLKETLIDEQLINVVSGPSMKMELRKESLPLFSFLHGNKSYIESSWRLKEDGNIIVEKLLENVLNNGGEIKCNSEVVNILDSETGIISVLCSDGKEYGGDYFISDIHPQLLCNMLDKKKRQNRQFIRRMKNGENTFGMFTVSLVVRQNILPYFNYNTYIYEDNVWIEEKTETSPKGIMISCRYPNDESNYTRQIDLLTPMSWRECMPWENTGVHHRGDSYNNMCEEKALECIRLAERAIPSLSEIIESKYISTPLTYRDYLSSPQGTAFGFRKDCRKSMLTFNSVMTPEKNLLLTGQNVLLSGVEGVTMTAFETCRHILGNSYIDKILNKC